MTPRPLYSAARMAVKLSRECERSSLDYDRAWHDYMKVEATRHRVRAQGYLQSRALLLRQFEIPLEQAA